MSASSETNAKNMPEDTEFINKNTSTATKSDTMKSLIDKNNSKSVSDSETIIKVKSVIPRKR